MAAAAGSGAAQQDTMPWVEKYRPSSLDELVAHEQIVSTIQRFIAAGRLPHLLFYGPPGTGKTSTILAIARQLYGKNVSAMTLELNASDSRGINVVRDQIQSFASRRSLFGSGIKLVILDEADSMTNDAQFALRRVIEQNAKNTRFCIICNFASKIIPALQSRCTRFRFAPLSREQMVERTRSVISKESITVSDEAVEAVLRLSGGDMRKVLNVLQAASMSNPEVTEDSVYTCTGKPRPSDMEQILEWLLNATFKDASDRVLAAQREMGLSLVDIVQDLGVRAMTLQLPKTVKCALLDRLSNVEYNLSFATSEKLQLGALVGAFALARAEMSSLAA